ncbi:MAG TPA: hypothetical protein V6D17_12450 [Candidatus Obscuribacterales bacterium]
MAPRAVRASERDSPLNAMRCAPLNAMRSKDVISRPNVMLTTNCDADRVEPLRQCGQGPGCAFLVSGHGVKVRAEEGRALAELASNFSTSALSISLDCLPE